MTSQALGLGEDDFNVMRLVSAWASIKDESAGEEGRAGKGAREREGGGAAAGITASASGPAAGGACGLIGDRSPPLPLLDPALKRVSRRLQEQVAGADQEFFQGTVNRHNTHRLKSMRSC